MRLLDSLCNSLLLIPGSGIDRRVLCGRRKLVWTSSVCVADLHVCVVTVGCV